MAVAVAMRSRLADIASSSVPFLSSSHANWIRIDWSLLEEALADAAKTPDQVLAEICEGK